MAAVDTFIRRFSVGRYQVEYRAQLGVGAPVSLECRWSPQVPRKLSPMLLREYRRQRDRVLAALAQRLGGPVTRVDVGVDGRLHIKEVQPSSGLPSKEESDHG